MLSKRGNRTIEEVINYVNDLKTKTNDPADLRFIETIERAIKCGVDPNDMIITDEDGYEYFLGT